MANLNAAFQKMLDGVRLADEGRDEIIRGMQEAILARTDLETQLADLRETIETQRRMMLEISQQIAELRRERNGGSPQ